MAFIIERMQVMFFFAFFYSKKTDFISIPKKNLVYDTCQVLKSSISICDKV